MKTKKFDMLSIFLENRDALPHYNTLSNVISSKDIYINQAAENLDNALVTCIYDFPSYIKGTINQDNWQVNTINSFKGSMIVLKNYESVEDYLKKNFSSKRRSKFRTYQKRLENAFNISYKTYYGDIERNEYEALFKMFRGLIERRFEEKKMKNYDLTRWDVYHKIAFPLIQNKEAALFVIYHNDKPISMCLNLIRSHVIYGYIRAYDIDYSKFYIGFIDFIKQLHWCYENDIQVFDLLKGSYAYKTYLTDDEYYFQKHIIFNKNNMLSKMKGTLLSFRIKSFYKLVTLLKKCHIDKLYHAYLNFRYRNKATETPKTYILKRINQEVFSSNQHIKIELTESQYAFLKRPVYDFLYRSQETLNHTEVFKTSISTNTFYVKGIKEIGEISFLKS